MGHSTEGFVLYGGICYTNILQEPLVHGSMYICFVIMHAWALIGGG